MDARNDAITVYCLGLIVEEAGEVAQASGQALRFGLDTPSEPESVRDARDKIEKELGDVLAAIKFAAAHDLIDLLEVERYAKNKLDKLRLDIDNLGRPLAPQPPRWP